MHQFFGYMGTAFGQVSMLAVLIAVGFASTDSKVLASEVFSNVRNKQVYITYQVINNVGSLMIVHVPEPTTATLSLLESSNGAFCRELFCLEQKF